MFSLGETELLPELGHIAVAVCAVVLAGQSLEEIVQAEVCLLAEFDAVDVSSTAVDL